MEKIAQLLLTKEVIHHDDIKEFMGEPASQIAGNFSADHAEYLGNRRSKTEPNERGSKQEIVQPAPETNQEKEIVQSAPETKQEETAPSETKENTPKPQSEIECKPETKKENDKTNE